MMSDTYHIERAGKECLGCIELVESHDDDGWYAHQYDFTRKDNATRTSSKIYATRAALVAALDSGKHRWGKWS